MLDSNNTLGLKINKAVINEITRLKGKADFLLDNHGIARKFTEKGLKYEHSYLSRLTNILRTDFSQYGALYSDGKTTLINKQTERIFDTPEDFVDGYLLPLLYDWTEVEGRAGRTFWYMPSEGPEGNVARFEITVVNTEELLETSIDQALFELGTVSIATPSVLDFYEDAIFFRFNETQCILITLKEFSRLLSGYLHAETLDRVVRATEVLRQLLDNAEALLTESQYDTVDVSSVYYEAYGYLNLLLSGNDWDEAPTSIKKGASMGTALRTESIEGRYRPACPRPF